MITCVLFCYNREREVSVLLRMLSEANKKYAFFNELVLVVDKDKCYHDFRSMAKQELNAVSVKLIERPVNFGLKKNILDSEWISCVSNEIIFFLEDDLVLSKEVGKYINENCKKLDEEVAGISTYSYQLSERNRMSFRANSNAHMIQLPSSWGFVMKKNVWINFINSKPVVQKSIIPDYIDKWGDNSWKKDLYNYMLNNSFAFYYPAVSYSSPSTIASSGTHQKEDSFCTPLYGSEIQYNSYFEPKNKNIKWPILSNGYRDIEEEFAWCIVKGQCPHTLVKYALFNWNILYSLELKLKAENEDKYVIGLLPNKFIKKHEVSREYYRTFNEWQKDQIVLTLKRLIRGFLRFVS